MVPFSPHLTSVILLLASFSQWIFQKLGYDKRALMLLPWIGLFTLHHVFLGSVAGTSCLLPPAVAPLLGWTGSWHKSCPVSRNVLRTLQWTVHPFSFALPLLLQNPRVIIKGVWVSSSASERDRGWRLVSSREPVGPGRGANLWKMWLKLTACLRTTVLFASTCWLELLALGDVQLHFAKWVAWNWLHLFHSIPIQQTFAGGCPLPSTELSSEDPKTSETQPPSQRSFA